VSRRRFRTVDDLPPSLRAQAERKLEEANTGTKDFAKVFKRNKFNAQKTEGPAPMGLGTVIYDSKKEAYRAEVLEVLRANMAVDWWERQRKFTLPATPGEERASYRVDFEVHWSDGRVTYEDCKGAKYDSKGRIVEAYKEFLRKKGLVEEIYGIQIEEI